ncbi:uncharacterized protein LOC106153736 [Lingula anatina]|uniref:Uncharacterized protein LOC106153736 n=1 Tax=Lingula anatina TaxID=7574 RepID=A0A1S3HDV4_LINAN|nr:uncharacterized protein LOC106153736 [Lingula anatina]|eukprot:XP_013383274.1 uncharacterized protein LOC106153736 [Lingula anatina]
MKVVFASCLLLPCVLGQVTQLSSNFLGPLTSSGGQYIVTQIQAANNDYKAKESSFQSATTTCQNLIKTNQEKICVPCIVDKCKAKAKSCNRELTFSGAIKTIGDLGGSVASKAKDVVDKVIGGIKDVFSGWGKRRSLAKRAEPSCGEIERNAGEACKKYQDQCSWCNVNANNACPGYSSARVAYESARNTYSWLAKVPTQNANYRVKAASYDQANFVPTSGKWSNVDVTVEILGKTTNFRVNQAINPYDSADGAVVATQAFEWWKRN